MSEQERRELVILIKDLLNMKRKIERLIDRKPQIA
jgi:hypothetical protein